MPQSEPKQLDDNDEPSSLTKEAVDTLMAIDELSEGLKEIEARFLADAAERRKKVQGQNRGHQEALCHLKIVPSLLNPALSFCFGCGNYRN